jgi:hypothetical protein
MTLKSCRECKAKVSSEAKTCPNCGISKPVKSGTSLIWVILFITIIFIILSPKNKDEDNLEKNSESNNVSVTQDSIIKTDLNVDLNTSVVSNNGNLSFKITSNLPKGTLLSVSLANPINKGGSGYYGESESSLGSEKSTDVGPFSQNGKPLPPGFYMVVVSISSLFQPNSVQSIIGKNGEYLKGNNVFSLAGDSTRMVWQRYVFEITPDGTVVNFNTTKNSEADSSLIPIK